MKRKLLVFLTTMIMTANIIPCAAYAVDEHAGQVHVIVENTTFTPESSDWDDQFWYGELVNTWITIDNDDTMMSCIVEALESEGHTQEGASSNYISSIDGMGEFDGGFMSGWMGTLNDWFTNAGFASFSVADGALEAGDEIRVMYTCAYGDDLGGSWGNNDTTVKNIKFSAGSLTPDFDKNTHEYTLTVPEGTESVLVTPTASNKNYQVRTRIGDTVYKRTAQVPIENNTEIIVECNYEGSLSMNTNGEAQVYTIKVVTDIAQSDDPVKFGGATVSLSGNIGVNFYMELGESVIADANAYMQFTLPNGDAPQVKVSEARQEMIDEKSYYVFSCEVAAKEMTDTITAQIITSNGEGAFYEYTVKDYAEYILGNPDDYDTEAVELVKSMLSYGDYAAAYFNGQNISATSEMNAVTAFTFVEFEKQSRGTLPKGIEYYGSSLLLESNTTIRHYFKVADGIDVSAYGFSGQKDDHYYKEIAGISAGKLGTVQDVTIGGYTISYSPMSYAYTVLSSDSTDESLKNLVKALYIYEQAAEAYQK